MRIFLIITSLLVLSFRPQPDIYSYSFYNIDGELKQMSQFKGKKLLIVVLPASVRKSDTSFFNAVNHAAATYSKQLSVLAVPATEDGYEIGSSRSLNQWYRGFLGDAVHIAEPMGTRKATASKHLIFSWLTDKNNNTHFDEDVKGAGQLFFINEGGMLYGLFGPESKLNDRLIQTALASNKLR